MATEVEQVITQAPGPAGQPDPARQLAERAARSLPGVPMLILGIVALTFGVGLLISAIGKSSTGQNASIYVGALLLIAAAYCLRGL